MDGKAIGLAADRSALGEVLMAAIAEAAPPDSLRAGFSSEIALRELYVPEGCGHGFDGAVGDDTLAGAGDLGQQLLMRRR